MKDNFFGDSYDLVKRFWADSLRTVAPLYAHPRFVPNVPNGFRDGYTLLTSIEILKLDEPPPSGFGLFLDPNTGIPLPKEGKTKVTPDHAPLPFIVELNEQFRPAYMICFDQSYHRKHELNRPDQMKSKQGFLQQQNISSFYYDSHAPFFFMAAELDNLELVRKRLLSLGIPERRIKTLV